MSSDIDFVEYVVEQMENAGRITYRKMFGEYAIYSDGKIVALICANQLFVKPTEGGKSFIGNVEEASPYPGAKMRFLIEDMKNCFEMAFSTEDVKRDFDKAIKNGAKELNKPETKPWGQTVAYVQDLDGTIIEICAPMR